MQPVRKVDVGRFHIPRPSSFAAAKECMRKLYLMRESVASRSRDARRFLEVDQLDPDDFHLILKE